MLKGVVKACLTRDIEVRVVKPNGVRVVGVRLRVVRYDENWWCVIRGSH